MATFAPRPSWTLRSTKWEATLNVSGKVIKRLAASCRGALRAETFSRANGPEYSTGEFFKRETASISRESSQLFEARREGLFSEIVIDERAVGKRGRQCRITQL